MSNRKMTAPRHEPACQSPFGESPGLATHLGVKSPGARVPQVPASRLDVDLGREGAVQGIYHPIQVLGTTAGSCSGMVLFRQAFFPHEVATGTTQNHASVAPCRATLFIFFVA